MVPPLCRRGPAVGLSHASSLRSRVRETVRAVLMQMPTAAPCGFCLWEISPPEYLRRGFAASAHDLHSNWSKIIGLARGLFHTCRTD